jgi:hypothetical protein
MARRNRRRARTRRLFSRLPATMQKVTVKADGGTRPFQHVAGVGDSKTAVAIGTVDLHRPFLALSFLKGRGNP